jgi:urease accessory protein
VGAYSYSQGLEWAVEEVGVTNEETASDWIEELLRHALVKTEGPVLIRLSQSWQAGDTDALVFWNQFILATRETSELQNEDQLMGRALAKVLEGLDVTWPYQNEPPVMAFVTPYSLAAFSWGISTEKMVAGYFWGWLENQVLAAIKLIPLGQQAGQRILFNLSQSIPSYVEAAFEIEDNAIGGSMPLWAIASSRHEIQYSRLFRS